MQNNNLFNFIENQLLRTSLFLQRLPLAHYLILSALVSLSCSLFFFSPKFWLMQTALPGTFEWDRALTFLQQCREPFNQNIEPAMRWRLLPPLVAHYLGMTGYSALILPVIGLVLFLLHWVWISAKILDDRLAGLLLAILLGTSGAVVTITNWLGINDAWFLLGLSVLVTGKRWPSLVIPMLLAPWVDERFIIALPLTIFLRWCLQGFPKHFYSQLLIGLSALLPYVLIRGIISYNYADTTSLGFVLSAVASTFSYFSFAHLGWWMGFRAGWILVALAMYGWWKQDDRRIFIAGLACLLASWGAITFLAADLTRSTNLLIPLLLCGTLALKKVYPLRLNLFLFYCTLFNLVTPLMLITYKNTSLIWALPFEVLRLF
jgi:uncharacterized membrane protein